MNRFFNKEIKFENCLTVLYNIISIIYFICILNSKKLLGIRIFHNNILSLVMLIICIILIISKIIFIFWRQNKKLEKYIYYISVLILLIIIIDCIFLGIIRNFIEASNLEKRPTTLDPLGIRISYIIINNYKNILSGIWTTIWLSFSGTVVGLMIAIIFISLKTLEIEIKDNELISFFKKIAQGFVDTYVTIFRGTPMMVQAIIIYYFLPGILASIFNVDQQVLNNILSVGVAGFITVTLNTTAYLTEVLRGGIESIDKGQMEAARSLGMTRTKAMINVILPQGIKHSLPSICNEFIINIKDTSVLSVISVMDLFFIINSINKKNASQDGIFIAAIIYLCLTFGISKLLRIIEKKMNLVSTPLPSCN